MVEILPDSQLWYHSEEIELTIFSGGFHADKSKLRKGPLEKSEIISVIDMIFVQESTVHIQRESRTIT